MIDISIVIVSWNTKKLLLECLSSVEAEPTSYKIEIIVVDNASQDGSTEAVQDQFPEVKLIRNEVNLGFSKANNIGIRESSGKYICLVNSDIRILGDCIESLYRYMQSHPSIGILGPKILSPDMSLQNSCRRFPNLWHTLSLALGLHILFPNSKFFCGEQMSYFSHDEVLKVDYLAGCFLMAKREAVEQVGLLDEQFFIYSEEVDWCKRFWRAGWEVVFFPEATVVHHLRASSSKDPLRFSLEQERARLQYWRKHHSLISRLSFACILLLGHTLRIATASVLFAMKPSKRAQISEQMLQSIARIKCIIS